jgi:hypothetical protein
MPVPTRVTTLARLCAEYAADRVIDFLKIDVETWERQVIAGNDWRRFRPRVVLVEATLPNSPEPAWADWEPIVLDNDYLFVWFDGLNRFYVRREDAALKVHFAVQPNVFDDFILWELEEAREAHLRLSESHMRLVEQHAELVKSHAELEREFTRVSSLASKLSADSARLLAQLNAVYRSHSWRITAPLRWLSQRLGKWRTARS